MRREVCEHFKEIGTRCPECESEASSNSALIGLLCGERSSGKTSFRGQMFDYFAEDLPTLTDQQLGKLYKYMRRLRAGQVR